MSNVTVNLKSTLVLKDGKRLGPGEVEMDERRAQSLGLLKPKGKATKEAAVAASAVSRPADIFDGLSDSQVQALKDAGFNTRRRLQKGLESGDVAAVEGIGPASVERLTQNLGS